MESQPGDWHIVKVYFDDASGATTSRKDLQNMLNAARAGLFDTLLVYKVDRFSRRLRDLVSLLDALADADVVFRSATEPFDTSTPIGRMLVQMLGVFAEFEREVIIDRVTAGMATKAAKGLWTGGARPFGYQVDRILDKLIPEPDEQAIVKRIFDLYTRDRLGTPSIAKRLNEEGLRTSNGKPWSGATLGWIVTNRVYTGEKHFGDDIVVTEGTRATHPRESVRTRSTHHGKAGHRHRQARLECLGLHAHRTHPLPPMRARLHRHLGHRPLPLLPLLHLLEPRALRHQGRLRQPPLQR